MKIGITGSNGFIGKHIELAIKSCDKHELIPFERSFFDNQTALDSFVKNCDVIVQSASVIKHKDDDFIYNENVRLINELINSVKRTNHYPHILFLSSVHSGNDTAYGKSKAKSEELLKKLTEDLKIKVTIIKLPGIFGEGQLSNFNSVVPTFCTQIINNAGSKINEKAETEILHVRHVVHECLIIAESSDTLLYNQKIIKGNSVNIKVLYNLLESFYSYDETGEIPELRSTYEKDLFNTFRFFLCTIKHPPVYKLMKRTDNRGRLFEIIRSGTKGQIFFSTTAPGVVRGNHYHTRKVERFCVVEGEGIINLVNLFTKRKTEIEVNGNDPVAVDIPTYHIHTIKNTGTSVLNTVFWANEFLNQNDTDVFTIS